MTAANPRVRLLACLGIAIVAAGTPMGAGHALCGLAVLVLSLGILWRVRPGAVLHRLLHLAPFLVLALVPPLLQPGLGWEVATARLAKAGIGCAALVVLAASTPADELLAGLAALRCPRRLVALLAVLARYLHLLGDEGRRMRRAAAARGFVPRNLLQAGTVGGMVGALFLRSHARAERVHDAMLARGGDGVPAPPPLPAPGWRDAAFLAAVLAIAIAWRCAP